MIKAFLFDYDGVITQGVKDGTVSERLAANLGVPIDKASKWLQAIWQPLLKAEITEDEAWKYLEAQYGKPINEKQRDIWFKWEELTPLPEMIKLLRTLKTKGYLVGLLSNVTATTAKIIRENGGYDEFDFLVLGCEIGCKKPEPEIFQAALKKLGNVQPSEVVFLEDREPNTIAASQLGMQTILVRDHAAAIKEVLDFIE
jgi:epoxide hydrolase-like predicted phosphatase